MFRKVFITDKPKYIFDTLQVVQYSFKDAHFPLRTPMPVLSRYNPKTSPHHSCPQVHWLKNREQIGLEYKVISLTCNTLQSCKPSISCSRSKHFFNLLLFPLTLIRSFVTLSLGLLYENRFIATVAPPLLRKLLSVLR